VALSARALSYDDFAPKRGEYSVLEAVLPGREKINIGVLLLDISTNALHLRLRRDWETVGEEEDVEVLAELKDDLENLASAQGGRAVFEWLEDSASQSIRVSDRRPITVLNFERTLGDLYREHVPVNVQPYRTHLPSFTLSAAAGPFLNNSADITATPEEWVEVPPDLRLYPDMFIARIQGQSMEPRIPHGSLCVFRHGVVGSRVGKLVLVCSLESMGDDHYTVKRYKSEKVEGEEEGWVHNRIRLESLNPAYPSWDLDPDEKKYQIVAEFIRVLE
jgi:phage repressor protein C with HTH and peptisase S24 domain